MCQQIKKYIIYQQFMFLMSNENVLRKVPYYLNKAFVLEISGYL